MSGAFDGLTVLELATGIAGPYAGRLFAMLGARVIKVEPPGGDLARRLPVDDRPVTEPGPLFVHLDGGKEHRAEADVDLGTVDIVIDDAVRATRAGTALDPAALARDGKVVVSVTAWGYDADDPGHPTDELLVQAASGMVPATMVDGQPYRFPGWQSQYVAGGYAVAAALTARSRGGGHHVDVSWVGAVLTGVEGAVAAWFHTADRPPGEAGGRDRQAGFQVGAFPAGVFRCADGHVIPGTVRPVDWPLQCGVYGRPDLVDDERFRGRRRWANRDALRAELQPWYDAHTKRDIFDRALAAGWACGMVMTAEDALTDPHLADRDFIGDAEVDGRRARVPARPWLVRPATAPVEAPPRPLEACRVLELTWAWAGPFVGRWLGSFGADVVRVEAGRYPDGWRTRLRWDEAGVDIPAGVDPADSTWDAAALHNSLNRNKRSVSIDLTMPAGRDLFLRLLAEADVLVVNMSARMLADRGIEADVDAAIERGLVVVNMPALGLTGPARDMPGYGVLMEGMGGFATRYGARDEGARSTDTYYPDLVAGLHGTIAALGSLADRRATGRGRLVDLSQQEVTWLQFGEAIALRSMEDREIDRLGAAEPRCAPSGYYPCADGTWMAVVVGDEREWRALVDVARPELDGFADLDTDGRCARRDALDAAVGRWSAARPAADAVAQLRAAGVRAHDAWSYRQASAAGALDRRGLVERLDHPVTGDRPYLALPVRIDGVPWRSRRRAACFAEHTDEVLAEWIGLEPAALAALRRDGVIGTTPTTRR